MADGTTRHPDSAMLREAIVLGGVAGLRSMAPLAALALRRRIGGDGAGRYALLAGATGELVGDKLPSTPSRTSPPALAGRLATAALVGWKVAGAGGAAAASAAAGVSAFAGERSRAAIGRRTGVPDPLIGAVEDLVAVVAAAAATRRAATRPAE